MIIYALLLLLLLLLLAAAAAAAAAAADLSVWDSFSKLYDHLYTTMFSRGLFYELKHRLMTLSWFIDISYKYMYTVS